MDEGVEEGVQKGVDEGPGIKEVDSLLGNGNKKGSFIRNN